jgi:hypothetical protein
MATDAQVKAAWIAGSLAALGAIAAVVIPILWPDAPPTTPPPIIPPTTPPPTDRTVSLAGEVLTMEVPEWWLSNPKRGSLNFSTHEEIENSRNIKAGLSVRTEGINPLWKTPDPWLLLATLNNGEQLCDITNAANSGSRFYIGLQAHCQDLGICSYSIEGNRLRVTINSSQLIISNNCND